MKKSNLHSALLVFTLLASLSSFAENHIPTKPSGPILVGGGAGASEYSVIFVKSNLKQLFLDCEMFACELSNLERSLWTRVNFELKEFPALEFVRAAELGNRKFEIQKNRVRINQDLLWLDSEKSIPFDVGSAVALWAQIAAARSGIVLNESLLAKVESAFRSDIRRSLMEWNERNSYEWLLWKSSQKNLDRLFIRDGALQNIELTDLILKEIGCGDSAHRVEFFSPAWQGHSNKNFSLGFGIKWQCPSSSGSGSAMIFVRGAESSEGLLRFEKSKIIIHVTNTNGVDR